MKLQYIPKKIFMNIVERLALACVMLTLAVVGLLAPNTLIGILKQTEKFKDYEEQ